MHWVVDDNLNFIFIEVGGGLLNGACEIDSIEGNN